jgi:hypothetical protein
VVGEGPDLFGGAVNVVGVLVEEGEEQLFAAFAVAAGLAGSAGTAGEVLDGAVDVGGFVDAELAEPLVDGFELVLLSEDNAPPRRRRSCARSPTGGGASRCRHTVVHVPPGSPSVVFGVVWKPRVCLAPSVPVDGRSPGGSQQTQSRNPLAQLGAPARTIEPDHAEAAQRFFITSTRSRCLKRQPNRTRCTSALVRCRFSLTG